MSFKKLLCIFITIFTLSYSSFSQGVEIRGVSISEDNSPPSPYAVLDVRSQNRGVNIPTVTYADLLDLTALHNSVEPEVVATEGLPEGLMFFVEGFGDEPENPQQLTVFYTKKEKVKEQEIRGFYYWSGTAFEQIRPKDTQYPIGSIIMLTGKVNENGDIVDYTYAGGDEGLLFKVTDEGKGYAAGKMDGWYICNGKNGTPDMKGKFIVSGGKNHNEINKPNQGHDFIAMDDKTMPPHKHPVDKNLIKNEFLTWLNTEGSAEFLQHSHQINSLMGHTHELTAHDKGKTLADESNWLKVLVPTTNFIGIPGNSHKRTSGDRVQWDRECTGGWVRICVPYPVYREVEYDFNVNDAVHNIKETERSSDISLDIGVSSQDFLKYENGEKTNVDANNKEDELGFPFELRPGYKVVIYVMRKDDGMEINTVSDVKRFY